VEVAEKEVEVEVAEREVATVAIVEAEVEGEEAEVEVEEAEVEAAASQQQLPLQKLSQWLAELAGLHQGGLLLHSMKASHSLQALRSLRFQQLSSRLPGRQRFCHHLHPLYRSSHRDCPGRQRFCHHPHPLYRSSRRNCPGRQRFSHLLQLVNEYFE
jgi:hypothetical protein